MITAPNQQPSFPVAAGTAGFTIGRNSASFSVIPNIVAPTVASASNFGLICNSYVIIVNISTCCRFYIVIISTRQAQK